MIVCVAPNPSIDRLFAVDRLVPGAIHRPDALVPVAGGKGLNVARAAAALGADVHAVALLGGHAGRWLEAELARDGVRLSAVWTESETRTCLSVADSETGSLTEFYENGSAVAAAQWLEFVQRVQELAVGASWTTISGSTPPGAATDAYVELAPSGTVAVDTRELGDACPALLKVNASEAAGLIGRAVETPDAALDAALSLRERIGGDGHAAIVTRGRDGAVMVAPDGSVWSGSLDAIGAYPVGSGDAFLAGFVVALDGGADWAAALAAALGAAAANAEVPGAGRVDAQRAQALADRASIVQASG